jgi:glucosylceramidase
VRIGFENPDKDLMITAAQNPDGTVAVVLFNPTENEKQISLSLNGKTTHIKISAKALQTVVFK